MPPRGVKVGDFVQLIWDSSLPRHKSGTANLVDVKGGTRGTVINREWAWIGRYQYNKCLVDFWHYGLLWCYASDIKQACDKWQTDACRECWQRFGCYTNG